MMMFGGGDKLGSIHRSNRFLFPYCRFGPSDRGRKWSRVESVYRRWSRVGLEG
jgi:hypothetical protein